MQKRNIVVVYVLGFVVFFTLLALWLGIRTVPAGYVGVHTRWGKALPQPMHPGIHLVIPFADGVVKLETRLKAFVATAEAASKDVQKVDTGISVQHSLAANIAPKSYQEIGRLEDFDTTVVSPAVYECFKAVVSKYTAEELITKRDIVKHEITDAVQAFIDQTLKDKGIEGALHVSNVAINDFGFSREFDASIEAKVKAAQEALRAENEKKKRITEAEASAKEKELAASAEAFKIEQESTARAAAIEREAKALAANPLLLQLRAIEKWNGSVPRFTGSNNMVPFVDIEAMTKDE